MLLEPWHPELVCLLRNTTARDHLSPGHQTAQAFLNGGGLATLDPTFMEPDKQTADPGACRRTCREQLDEVVQSSDALDSNVQGFEAGEVDGPSSHMDRPVR